MKNKGISLIEVVVAISILAAGVMPIYSMMTNTNRQYERQVKNVLANHLARSVLERIISMANDGIDKIPTHEPFLQITKVKGKPQSPWFSLNTKLPLTIDNTPILDQELESFTLSVRLDPIDGLENQKAKLAIVEIRFLLSQSKEQSISLKTLISEYVAI